MAVLDAPEAFRFGFIALDLSAPACIASGGLKRYAAHFRDPRSSRLPRTAEVKEVGQIRICFELAAHRLNK